MVYVYGAFHLKIGYALLMRTIFWANGPEVAFLLVSHGSTEGLLNTTINEVDATLKMLMFSKKMSTDHLSTVLIAYSLVSYTI